jgi:DinB family protein
MAGFDVVRKGLSDYFRMVQTEVHGLTAPLTSEQLWKRPYPYGNTIGNLILHLTGNLSYYIGTQIAGTGYIRHRELEFSDSGKPKESLLGDFDQAVETVLAAIAKQSDEDWLTPYSADREPESGDRFAIFLRCAGHAYHHAGQIIYLQKELLRNAKS